MTRIKKTTHNITGNTMLFRIMLAVMVTAYLSGCRHTQDAGSEENVPEQHVDHTVAGNTVELSPQQYKAIGIELGSVEQKNLSATLKTTGFLKVPPQNKANISAPIGGMVQNILVHEGEYVQKGQPVLSIMNPEFVKMQQEYLIAKEQLTYAAADFTRQKELSEQQVASQKIYQQVTADFNSLKAKVNSLQQQLAILHINTASLTAENISAVVSLRSPISGSISHIDINIGSNVESSRPLMDVVDNKQLHVDLFVFEQDLPKIKEGQQVDLTLINMPGTNYTATIFAVGNAFENETKTIPVHAEITGNKEGLIEGMNVTAFINTERRLMPAVPSTSIINNGGNDFIFIELINDHAVKSGNAAQGTENKLQDAGETKIFERIQVKRGITNGNYTGITSLSDSLTENTKVVTNGAFYLMAMLTNAGEEGHDH